MEFIFNTSALEGFPIIYYSSLRAQPTAVPALQEALYQRFPTVTVVNMADVLQIVQGVVDRISEVVRFISMFAILAGAIILSSSVAGTRFRRMREVVILKTLGATRWRVSRIFSVEFLVLGGVAGLMGSLLAGGFATLLLSACWMLQRLSPLSRSCSQSSPRRWLPTPRDGWPASPSLARNRLRSCANSSYFCTVTNAFAGDATPPTMITSAWAPSGTPAGT